MTTSARTPSSGLRRAVDRCAASSRAGDLNSESAARGGAAPDGDQFATWRRFKAEEGQKDVERFLVDWTELRIVLELANANQLAVGLLFYE